MLQQRRTKHLINIEHINSDVKSVGLSPVRLYHLNTTNIFQGIECPENTKCFKNYNFHWHGKKEFHVNLICSHLGDHVSRIVESRGFQINSYKLLHHKDYKDFLLLLTAFIKTF